MRLDAVGRSVTRTPIYFDVEDGIWPPCSRRPESAGTVTSSASRTASRVFLVVIEHACGKHPTVDRREVSNSNRSRVASAAPLEGPGSHGRRRIAVAQSSATSRESRRRAQGWAHRAW